MQIIYNVVHILGDNIKKGVPVYFQQNVLIAGNSRYNCLRGPKAWYQWITQKGNTKKFNTL